MNGWPFLVARGRRRGYRILMAPGFLVADEEYGLLDEAVSPGTETGPPQVVDVTTPTTRRSLTLAYTTHHVTAADIGATGSGPRDEHSRPLALLYGFVCAEARIAEPAAADLRQALDAALEVYRTFLDDEDGAAVVASGPFPLRSRVVTATPHTNAPRTPPKPVRPRLSPWNLTAVALTVAIVVVLAVMWTSRSGHQQPRPCATPSVGQQAQQPKADAATLPPCPTSPGK